MCGSNTDQDPQHLGSKGHASLQGDVTDCKIKTREVEDCADFNFAKANIIREGTPVCLVLPILPPPFLLLPYSDQGIFFV